MITEISPDLETFQKKLQEIYEHHKQEGLPENLKEKAWKRFLELGLPTKHLEAFQYIRLRSLYQHSFASTQSAHVDAALISPHILPECAESVLVVVNGDYKPELSHLSALPKRLVILPLHEATRTYGSFINNHWNKLIKEDTDPFSLLNAALHRQGIFLYAPPKTILNVPIQIIHFHTEEAALVAPRFQGFIGSQSQLDIVTTHVHASTQTSLSTLYMDMAIDEDSHVRHFQDALGLSKTTWHFDAFRASLKRNSTLKSVLAANGTTSLRNDYRITLTGENAEANLNGIWMLSDNHEAHAHILMEHQAPHCRSMQFFKSALDDASRSSFEGKILVQQAAQKTEAFQLNNNLLLSDGAKADSKPNLEIFADDVKASHGATMGQLDAEQLFYLRTRGYTEKEAKNLLVYGFCKEIIDMIPVSSMTDRIQQYAKRYLES